MSVPRTRATADNDDGEEKDSPKQKKTSFAPLRIKLGKSGNFVINQTDIDKLQKNPDKVEDQKDLKKAQETGQKTGQKAEQKNLKKKKMKEIGEEDKNQMEHSPFVLQDAELTEEAEEPPDDDSVSGSSSKSESLVIITEKNSNVIKLDDTIPLYRDNSSNNAVFSFKTLSGHSQFLTEADCREFLAQPFALISSDTLLWLMTSVGNEKYDPTKHYLFDHMHLANTYMGAEDVSSRPFIEMSRATVNALFKTETVYIPVHFRDHFSLVVIEGLSRFLSCVQKDTCQCSPTTGMIASHYDSLALSSSHKMHLVRNMIAFLVKDGLQSIGHTCSVPEVHQHLKLSRVTKKKDQAREHVTCGPFVALYFKEHLNNSLLTTPKEMRRKLVMDLLKAHKDIIRVRYNEKLEKKNQDLPSRTGSLESKKKDSFDASETKAEDFYDAPVTKKKDSSESVQNKKRPLSDSQDCSTPKTARQLWDEKLDTSTNYYRLELRSVLRSKSAADILQLCNHWVDECFWNACGKDKELIPIRVESERKKMKEEFKSMYAENLKKGSKIPASRKDRVLWLSMGAMLMVLESCYLLPGGASAEKVFIAMRTYPQSEVWCRACDLLFISGSCAKISFQDNGLPVKGTPLQKYVRILFGLFRGHKKGLGQSFTPRSRVILQEISVHVVAILEYVLQCSDVAALDPSGLDSASERDLAIAEELKGIDLVEREHIPHRNAGRFIENANVVSEEPFSGPTFKRMKTALEVAVKVMNDSTVRLIALHKNSRRVSSDGKKKKNIEVPSDFLLREYSRPVFSETLLAVEKQLQSVIDCEIGTETLNRIQTLFCFASVCLAASHGLETPEDVSLESLRKPDVELSEEKEDMEVSEEPKEVQPQVKGFPGSEKKNICLSKEVKPELSESQASTSGFSLQIADSSNTFMRYHEIFSPVRMIYIPCVLQLVSCVLRLRHHSGTCRNKCLKDHLSRLNQSFRSFLQRTSYGFTGSRMIDVDTFRIDRLRDSIVLGSMKIMAASNHPCMEEFRYPKKSQDGTLNIGFVGFTTASNSGVMFSWAGVVLEARPKNLAYPAWSNSSTIAFGDICFPYSRNGKHAVCDLVTVDLRYELQWDLKGTKVPEDANGKQVDFMEMDFVAISFIDKTTTKTESHFGIVLTQPRSDKEFEEREKWVLVTMVNDASSGMSRLTDSIAKWRSDKKNDVIVALRKLEREGIRQHSRVFEAIWKGFYKMDNMKLLGFANPQSLVRSFSQRFWDMVSVVQCRLVQEHATINGGTRDTAVQQSSPLSVDLCNVAGSMIESARDAVSEAVRKMRMKVNGSQLNFIASWASHITAYHHFPVLVQQWMSERIDSLGSGRKMEVNISSSMFFCQGPPGTGKSHVATILVWATTRKHFGIMDIAGHGNSIQRQSRITDDLTGRVLVLTVTNAAVDDLLMKYFRATENDLDSMFAPLRLGSMTTEEFVKQFEAFRIRQSKKLSPLSLMNQKRAIFSTLGAAMIYDWNENIRKFDLIVIDEAAYASEPELTAVLARVIGNVGEPKFGTSVVLFGDQAQLPPFDDKAFPSWTKHRRKNLHLFSRALSLLSKEPSFPEEMRQEHVAMWEQTPRIVMQLQTQMRSAPPIGNYVSHHFYEGKIQNGPRPTDRYWVTSTCMITLNSRRFPLRVVNFVDKKQNCAIKAKNAEVPDPRGGYKNPYEIYVITQMLQDWKSAHIDHRVSRGFLTPYVSQKNAIKQALRTATMNVVSVLTFLSAQGKEFDVVLLSLVRTYVEQKSSIAHLSPLTFLNDKNRTCVAISRAREILIVLGKLRAIALGSSLCKNYLTSHLCFPQNDDSEFRDFLYFQEIIETY